MSGKQENLPAVLYKYSLYKYKNDITWLKHVKSILDEFGLSFIWDTQYFVNDTWLYTIVKQNLVDQFKQKWHTYVQESPKAINYRNCMYEENCEFEYYFKNLDDRNIITLCTLRTENHRL